MDSIWTRGIQRKARTPLPGDRKIHTVVIGGGMAGILTAWMLQNEGVPVAVLEADQVGSGQTSGTTAKVTSQHNLIYDRLEKSSGAKTASQYARFNEEAIEAYEEIIKKEKIQCHFTRCPAFLYSCTDTELLQKETEAAKKAGISASFEKDCELPFAVAGVMRFERQAKFHPLEFLTQLSDKVTVYEHTRVLRVQKHIVYTDRGNIHAKNIVFASHYPFINIPGFYFTRMYQERSLVLALKNTWIPEGYYLGIDKDGLSFRGEEDILLLGGMSHRSGTDMKKKNGEVLLKEAKNMWPDCRVSQFWSAQDCITPDGIPYIGNYSKKTPNWYVATGFGKWGMTSSMVSARILAGKITGNPCVGADIFAPDRGITIRAAGKICTHSLHTAAAFGKRLLPAKKRHRKAGSGTVVRQCPHLGCRLAWNAEEETYECPCHGSRFDRDGKLLDNPAQTDCQCRR